MTYSKKLKNLLKSIFNRLPYIKTLHKLNSNSRFPAGHYYSSVVSLEEIKERQNEIWKENISSSIEGIDLNTKNQIDLLKDLSNYYSDLPFTETKTENRRYHYFNSYYSYTDAIILFLMIRHFKPEQIIEIGSGYSSALMIDTNILFFNERINLKFVEPYPDQRLNPMLEDLTNQNYEVIAEEVQKVEPERFKSLKTGDILFIDSSHVIKTGSDVNYILFEILPILQTGVLIHFHDIHFPFEYPKDWVFNGFGWNEAYFIKAFLMYNKQYEIILFSDYIQKHQKDAFSDMPLTNKDKGSSLWLIKR